MISAASAATTATHGAGDPHRLQEPLREQGQRGQRARHRDRGEDHRPAGARHRGADGFAHLGPGRQLLAKARDQEQRVVHRQAQPHPDHQVEREHAQPVDVVDAGEHEERAEHGDHADHDRHQRRPPAEEQDRERDQQREGQQLGEARDRG